MSQEMEKYVHDKENFVIINVPPNFMFKAQVSKAFSGSRGRNGLQWLISHSAWLAGADIQAFKIMCHLQKGPKRQRGCIK